MKGPSTADTSLLRALAGPSFRRADTSRDERAEEPANNAERILRDLAGWLPPRTESRSSVLRYFAQIDAVQSRLKGQPDSEVKRLFSLGVKGMASTGVAARRAAEGGSSSAAVHMAEAWACIGEASARCLALSPHPVQYAGARMLLTGRLAEMNTGEGKTLVAAMAAVLVAASGARVHVISTNDYLAQRDCEEMSPLFEFFRLTGGFIQGGMSPPQRAIAYAAHICYVSGKELVFDYLKDRAAGHGKHPSRVSQLRALDALESAGQAPPPLVPALHFAIVDEADSVLIDEARTPMILSREAPNLFEPELLAWAVSSAGDLQVNQHYVWGPGRSIELLPAAVQACKPIPGSVRAAWRTRAWKELLLRQALQAQHLFLRDQQYIVTEGKVQIVDESTGRVMPDRTWEQGLHQLIEVKEGLNITEGRETMERMTFQRFFRRYYLLAGLTGTAVEAARELWNTYRLRVCRIPPNRPSKRVRLPDQCHKTPQLKWQAVARAASQASARGQPVLIGTRSVEASEQLAAELHRIGVAHVVLNARQDSEEAAVVATAGVAGRITVATNMAGRGTDIKPDRPAIAAGGLHVILTEFHESPRIDRQLIGRSARQGEAGSAQAIVSAQDSLFRTLPGVVRALLASGSGAALSNARVWAQVSAEHRARLARKQTLRKDRELSRTIGFAGNSR